MSITHITAHHIRRADPHSKVQVCSRESELEMNGQTQELCRELKKTYLSRSGKQHGRFSDDTSEFPMKAWLQEFIDQRIGFLSFSKNAMQHLSLELEKTECALDCTLITFTEDLEEGQFFYCFVLIHNQGLYLDGNLELCQTQYLDGHDVQLAARVKITPWLAGENQHYLSILRWRGEKDLSEVFSRFIGFTDKIDTAEQTNELLGWVADYSNKLPSEHAQTLRAAAVDYCLEQGKQDRAVVLDDLCSHIAPEAQSKDVPTFSQFVETVRPNDKMEFIPDPKQLRSFARISGRSENISMSFAANCLGESIVYDAETDSLTIRNIPAPLKARLIKHLQKAKPSDGHRS